MTTISTAACHTDFVSLAESLLVQDFTEGASQGAGQVLTAIHDGFLPGSPEHDAVTAALARGYVPGTHQFNEFFAWSAQLLMRAHH